MDKLFGFQPYFIGKQYHETILCHDTALAMNGLMYSTDSYIMYTPYKELDNMMLGGIVLRHYVLLDTKYCLTRIEGTNLWLPSAERALVDVMLNMDHYWNEGPLIESLQGYFWKYNNDLHLLYITAQVYGLSRETLDYWIKEAREETDMSMG